MNVGCKDDGYLVLMRSGCGNNNTPDKQQYRYYRDNVLLPFISKSRLEYDNDNDQDDCRIPDELTAVSWCDGDLAQIASIADDVEIFSEHKVIGNK